MPKRNISFSIFQFIIESRPFTLADFESTIAEWFDKQEIWWDIVSVMKIEKEILNNRFISFYFEWWDRFPYSETVVDITSETEHKNPRDSELVELNEQLFVLFDTTTQRIYLSDRRKKIFLNNWYKEWLWKEIFIKCLIDKWDFLDKIEEIWEVSFSAEPNLLLTTNALWHQLLQDIYWYGATDMQVTLNYHHWKHMGEDLKQKIPNLILDWGFFKNVAIILKTGGKFGSFFNLDGVINKVSLSLDTNNITRKLDCKSVFLYLIDNIINHE